MDFLIPLVLGLLVALVVATLSILPLRRATVKELRQKTREELEQSVFRYEDGYFSFIGHDHPDVIAFKKLVEARDLRGIRDNWKKLSSSFRGLEWQAGYRGRPLIMDYYHRYELDLKELARRKHGRSGSAPRP
jgi:hypothetical protein